MLAQLPIIIINFDITTVRSPPSTKPFTFHKQGGPHRVCSSLPMLCIELSSSPIRLHRVISSVFIKCIRLWKTATAHGYIIFFLFQKCTASIPIRTARHGTPATPTQTHTPFKCFVRTVFNLDLSCTVLFWVGVGGKTREVSLFM